MIPTSLSGNPRVVPLLHRIHLPRVRRWAGAALGLLLATSAPQAQAARNILFLIADDLGFDSSSLTATPAANVSLPPTPNIDALGASGVTFTHAYARPTCSATRATLLTGRHGFRTGVGVALSGAKPGLRDDEYTLPRAFAANAPDYALASFGKWHLANGANTPLTVGGWPYFAGFNAPGVASYTNWSKITNGVTATSTVYSTTDQVNEAVGFINTQTQQNKPWLAWVAFNAPHSPFHKPPVNLLAGITKYTSLSGTTAHINANQRLYFEAMMVALDTEIGRLLQSVDRSNTDIIFVGDNGTENAVIQPPFKYAAENHAKFTVFEGGVRVPLVITGPDVAYIGKNDSLVSTVDIWATIQELAGIDVDATIPAGVTVDSKSLVPLIKENVIRSGDLFDEQFNQSAAADGQTLRDERYKLIRFDSQVERFYDLQNDPYENTNLLASTLTADAAAHYKSLKRKFQNYLALPNAATTRDPFPFPVNGSNNVTPDSFSLDFSYSQLRTNAIYTLWRTPDLGDPLKWEQVGSLPVSGVASGTLGTVNATLTDPQANGGSYFYQVVPSRW
ncbi:sulfatase-like hydrolase/transferase [Luteolibacter ambystomatis]|uniref:Sulfatase-like hydrolase/transferase n=1 Tax=Luteolibacter ambystomatis TaxID=2824561 RepID=A0A975G786_9BACT|nr:sulfatase-like hydrolase/transferase [Luteolibacter ambystomatis]QUE50614.1 sulfatase-like hydrolase/transferase [Luteolibacter ambystomatis]